MNDFTRTELFNLGGGAVVFFAPQGLYDLRCYFEAMEAFLESSHIDRHKYLSFRADINPAIREYLQVSGSNLIWEEYFPSELRASVLVSIMSFFERYLHGVCCETGILARKPFSHKQLKGSSISRAEVFLMDLCSLSLPKKSSWETMKKLQRLRNQLVHNGGLPDSSQAEGEAKRLAAELPGCSYEELGFMLEAEFIHFALDSADNFLDEMKTAISALYTNLVKFERTIR